MNFYKKLIKKDFTHPYDKIVLQPKGMNTMIIDTHCHLNFEDFNEDIDSIFERAINQQVEKIIVIGTDHKSNLKAIQLAETYRNMYATVGIHPGSIAEASDFPLIIQWLTHPKVVAIGECGLDFFWTKDNKLEQINLFKKHIELAVKFKKPLVIHTRDSFAVADAYEAMTSNRVYRDRMSKEDAIAEIIRCKGTQFDPQIVEAFLVILNN